MTTFQPGDRVLVPAVVESVTALGTPCVRLGTGSVRLIPASDLIPAAALDALRAVCADMLPLLQHAEECEANADDGNGERLRSLRRRLANAKAALALAAPAPAAEGT